MVLPAGTCTFFPSIVMFIMLDIAICHSFLVFHNGAELTAVHARAALDTLILINGVGLADLTGNCPDRTIAGAKGTAFTLISLDEEFQQRRTFSSRTAPFLHMGHVFIFKSSQRGENWIRSRLSQTAQCRILDNLTDPLEFFYMLFLSPG